MREQWFKMVDKLTRIEKAIISVAKGIAELTEAINKLANKNNKDTD